MKIKTLLTSLLKHPLFIAVTAGLLFSVAISRYSNNSSQNIAMIQLGFMPSQLAYTRCTNAMNDLGNAYLNIEDQARLIQRLKPTFEMNTPQAMELVSIEESLEKFETIANNAYTKQTNYCNAAYDALALPAEILNIETKFNKIKNQRNTAIKKIDRKTNFLEGNIANIQASSLADLNVFFKHAPEASPITVRIFKAKELYTVRFSEIYLSLLHEQLKRSMLEEKYYQHSTSLLRRALKKRLHKNIWQYMF